MSKTLKKESGKLKFDTSLNNLKCFIHGHSKNKNSQSQCGSKTSRRKTKQKYERKKKIEFQDKDFLSSVVCKVLNDVNAQEITQLIDNMNFPTSASNQKERNRQTPSEEIEHMQMKQIFNVQDANKTQLRTYKNQQQTKINGQNPAIYYLPSQTASYEPKMIGTPQKMQCPSTFQSSFSDSFTLSPEEQKVYSQYSPYNYPYMYYQNPNIYRQQQKKRKNISNQQISEFKIIPEKIQIDGRTTLMVRHIPNKYSQELLFEEISKNYKNKINFLYLPIDNYNQCNVGYAFVNFIHTKFIKEFYNEFSGRRWDKFNSQKICQLTYARIQGANSLISHFQNGLTSIKNRIKEDKKGKGSAQEEGLNYQTKEEQVNFAESQGTNFA